MKSISIILPALNEAPKIQSTLSEILIWSPPSGFVLQKIIVIDDGSNDTTAQIVSKELEKDDRIILLCNEKNMGKGFSIRKGVLTAHSDIIGFTDADLAYSPYLFNSFIEAISSNQTDLAIGSRWLKNDSLVQSYSKKRLLASFFFRQIVKALKLVDLSDPQCGLKFFSREVVDKVFPLLSCNRFAFDVELLYVSRLMNFRIKEIPVKMNEQNQTTISFTTETPRILLELLKIKKKFKSFSNSSAENRF